MIRFLPCFIGFAAVAGAGVGPAGGARAAAESKLSAAGLERIPFHALGKIVPRASREIASSDWSVGRETLDRDFASYAAYKSYLGPLGAKAVRLQAGWAKTEQPPGTYDGKWLDVNL